MTTQTPLIQLPKDNNLTLFTSHYPTNRRTYGVEAERAWAKASKLTTLEVMITAVESDKQSDQWKRGIIPLMSTWLSQQRWRNSSTVTPSASPSPIQMQIHNGEYLRVLEDMRAIKNSYAEHQSWTAADKAEFSLLKDRRNELRKLLNILR